MNSTGETETSWIAKTFNKDYYFGSVYSDYDNFYDWKEYAEELMKQYTFDSFLDVGCGCGNLVKEIKSIIDRRSQTKHDIQGVDASRFAVRRAGVPYVTQADCRQLPFNDRQFDFVYVFTTFSYLPDLAAIHTAIQEAYRVSNRLVVFEDVYEWPKPGSEDYDPRRRQVFSQKQWAELWQAHSEKTATIDIKGEDIIIDKSGNHAL